MRILQITPYFYPSVAVGGTASVVYQLSKVLVKKGHQVTVYTTDLLNRSKRVKFVKNKEIILEGIKIYYFSNISNRLAYQYHLFLPIQYFSHILKNIEKFDIIHFHEFYTLMNIFGGFLAQKYRIPYIISGHNTIGIIKEAGRVFRKKLFFKLAGRNFLKNAAKLIALTPEEKESYIKSGAEEGKIEIIPTGINLEEFNQFTDQNTERNRYDLKKNTIVLLFLGRIHKVKGIELLLNSLYILKKQGINLFLLIAGPVEDEFYMNNLNGIVDKYLLKSNVKFLGELDNNGKKSVFSCADIFILPSYSEGLSVSALQAAASGLPLIVTRNCGMTLINKYKAGEIVDSKPISLAKSIKKIISKRDFRRYYGQNAIKMIKDNFDLRITTAKLEAVYRD